MTDESHEDRHLAGDDLHEPVGEPPAPGSDHDRDAPVAESRLTPSECADEVLVQALAEGASHEAAAGRAKVSTRTVRRRAADPAFARKVRAARRQMTDEASGRATALLSAAMDQIGNVLRTGDPSTQLRAAVILLRTADQAALIDDLTQRVEDLEAALGGDEEGAAA